MMRYDHLTKERLESSRAARARKAEHATTQPRPAWMSNPALLPKEPPLGRRKGT